MSTPPPAPGQPAGESTGAPEASTAAVRVGWCSNEVAAELPGLRLLCVEATVLRAGTLTGDSPVDVQSRLRELSNRFRGGRAVSLRREPVPAAYRVFFRQIGMDPDVVRTPIEAAVLERMLRGGFPTDGLLADVLSIALLDTGVPVWALDGEAVTGELGIRASDGRESLGADPQAPPLATGRLVVADSRDPLAVLFGEIAPDRRPAPRSSRLALFAVQVPGVPTLYAEEALWSCQTALARP